MSLQCLAIARIERGERLVKDVEALAIAAALRVPSKYSSIRDRLLLLGLFTRKRTHRVAKLEWTHPASLLANS